MIQLSRATSFRDRCHDASHDRFSSGPDEAFAQCNLPRQILRARKKRISALAALLVIGDIASAQAKLLAKHGNWQAYSEVVKKIPRCSMTNNEEAHYFQVYYKKEDDHLSLQISSRDWHLPIGGHYDYKMQFDQEDPWTATATSDHYTDGTSYIDADVKGSEIVQWLEELAHSQFLVISFPGSKVRPWVLDLTGTHDVVQPFVDCVEVLLNK